MSLYFGMTEITNVDCLVPNDSKDITQIFFGDKEVFTVWGEYDGALPAQFNANGDDLSQYKVYGNTGGVGDRTVNHFDESAITENKSLNSDGSLSDNQDKNVSDLIPISANSAVISWGHQGVIGGFFINVVYYDSNKVAQRMNTYYVSMGSTRVSISPGEYEYVRFDYENYLVNVMLTDGEEPPQDYIPYGYKVDMSVSDGTTSTTTPIYIGDEPLDAIGDYVDYVDYHAGKIVKIIKKYVFTGSEPIWRFSGKYVEIISNKTGFSDIILHSTIRSYSQENNVEFINSGIGAVSIMRISVLGIESGDEVMPYLKSLYDNGTPAIIWYASKEPVESDPPVPLPALPTVDGVTITDYAGQSTAPSKFYAKYRKENF